MVFEGISLEIKRKGLVNCRMSRHIGSIQLSGDTFLPRVQETLHIEQAFVAFGFLKVIELMSRDLRRFTQRYQMSRNNGAREFETVGPFFGLLKETLSRVCVFLDCYSIFFNQ